MEMQPFQQITINYTSRCYPTQVFWCAPNQGISVPFVMAGIAQAYSCTGRWLCSISGIITDTAKTEQLSILYVRSRECRWSVSNIMNEKLMATTQQKVLSPHWKHNSVLTQVRKTLMLLWYLLTNYLAHLFPSSVLWLHLASNTKVCLSYEWLFHYWENFLQINPLIF